MHTIFSAFNLHLITTSCRYAAHYCAVPGKELKHRWQKFSLLMIQS